MRKIFPLLLGVLGVLLAAAVEARPVRIATFNIQNGPGAPGTTDYEATKAVLGRINADIVALQELLLSNEPALLQMAQELGYAYVEIGRDGTTMSGNQKLGYFSRFPMAEVSVVRSPAGANEMSRLPMRVAIEVPGAAKRLVIWNMHHKADDTTPANTPGNQFRRAIEAYRIVQDINAHRAANPEEDEFVMLGDLNDDVYQAAAQAVQFDAIPPLTAGSYQLGADVAWPVPYRAFPDDRYAAAGGGLSRLDLRQQNGTSRATRPVSGRTLDYLLVSQVLRDSPLGAPRGEVYHSQWDELHPGLPKAGNPLAANTSLAASDHLALFADIEMTDAEPATFVTSFSPAAGAPGAEVVISGLFFGSVESVRFGGVEASFTIESDTEIRAIVPAAAATGPITLAGPAGEASSLDSFLVAALPTAELVVATPTSLEGFRAMTGAPSLAQSFTVSAAGLRGPLVVTAPPGFEVSSDGTNFHGSVEVAGVPRADRASNYAGQWLAGSNEGNGFGEWTFFVNEGRGEAVAFIGDPVNSQVAGMAPTAFALRAGPQNADAGIWTYRSLQRPLAVGESLSFDWGINWDSNNNESGGKGFIIASGSAAMIYVDQGGFPGNISIWPNGPAVDTGIEYGTDAMRWTFRQVDTTTLNITATSRTGGTSVAYSTNVTVPGAVNSFWWYADSMEPDVLRYSYYDNLAIQPAGPGGGAVEGARLHVRLAADGEAGEVAGDLSLQSDGAGLAAVALRGEVSAEDVPGSGFAAWLGGRPATFELLRRYAVGGAMDPEDIDEVPGLRNEGGLLSLTVLVREDDPALQVTGESVDDLTGLWSTDDVTVRGRGHGVEQVGVRAGFERREYAVPMDGLERRFLRLRVELAE